jgi:hypothetical protein
MGRVRKPGVFISGFPRAGTTMMCLLMTYFDDCFVFSKEERHPLERPGRVVVPNTYKYFVIKQPIGYSDIFTPEYTCRLLTEQYGYKIIFMVRHPLDVLVSRHKFNPSIYWVEPERIITGSQCYVDNLDNTNVIFVRYENLVEDPRAELSRVSDFIGCPFNDTFNNFYNLPQAKLKKNQSLNSPRPIDKNSINNWKKEEHIERVKEVLTPELENYIKILGYGI